MTTMLNQYKVGGNPKAQTPIVSKISRWLLSGLVLTCRSSWPQGIADSDSCRLKFRLKA